VKEGWLTKPLGDVCALATGGTPNTKVSEYWQDGEIPWLVSGDVHKKQVWDCGKHITELGMRNSNARMLPADSVLIALNGQGKTRGTVAMLRISATCNQSVVCMTPIERNRLLAEYLFYYLESQYQSIRDTTGDKDRRGLNMPLLRGIELPIAPLPEQRRIVAILDEAFADIATARANAEKNLGSARAIFESHLESVLMQRGSGWVEQSMADICAITSTLVDPRQDEYQDLIHVGAGNIESQTGALNDLQTAREEGLISGKFLFDDSMVLYSKIRPYLVKVARPAFSGLCSADMYPLAPTPSLLTRDYLYYMLLSKPFTDYAIQGSARAGMPKVNREHLFAYRALIPPVEKQPTLTRQLDSLREETQHLESIYQRKLAALDALKQSLLHHAFSGQL